MIHKLKTEPKIVGTKETLRALASNKVKVLYVAKDAQNHITDVVERAAREKNVPITYVNTMIELGKVCNVDVGTATAALIIE